MYQNIAVITAIALLVPGVLMAFVPMLPALTYMFVVALIFGIVSGFSSLAASELMILLGVALVSILIDHLSGILGAKLGGAHVKSLLWGLFGGILGTLMMPVIGSFIGLFLGVLISELYYRKHSMEVREDALKAAGSALLGSVAGVMVNVVLAIVFIILFFSFAL